MKRSLKPPFKKGDKLEIGDWQSAEIKTRNESKAEFSFVVHVRIYGFAFDHSFGFNRVKK